MTVPLTGFEQRGRVAPWTTRNEEDTWITELLATSNRWSMDVVGQSAGGNPMRLFSIGTGDRTILHVAQQHGPELSGREAWFTTMRQWADADDPELLDYLTQVTVLVMPTCHPDNLDVRNNSNDVNLNRDHVQLTQGETQAIHSVIRDHDPDVIVDWHEGFNISRNYASAPAYNLNADTEVLALSEELSNVVKTAIESAGATWELYQGPNNMMKGAENLCNNTALHNKIGVLLETERKGGDDTTAARRHDHHLIAVEAIWRWHHTQALHIRQVCEDAEVRVASRTGDLTLHEGTSWSGPVVTPPPEGYFLNANQVILTEVHRDLFEIQAVPQWGGLVIPMDQPRRGLVAYLVDPASPQQVVSAGEPMPPEPPTPLDLETISPDTVVGYAVQMGGVLYDVMGARCKIDGVEYDVELPMRPSAPA